LVVNLTELSITFAIGAPFGRDERIVMRNFSVFVLRFLALFSRHSARALA
jgi:hypothetical protein